MLIFFAYYAIEAKWVIVDFLIILLVIQTIYVIAEFYLRGRRADLSFYNRSMCNNIFFVDILNLYNTSRVVVIALLVTNLCHEASAILKNTVISNFWYAFIVLSAIITFKVVYYIKEHSVGTINKEFKNLDLFLLLLLLILGLRYIKIGDGILLIIAALLFLLTVLCLKLGVLKNNYLKYEYYTMVYTILLYVFILHSKLYVIEISNNLFKSGVTLFDIISMALFLMFLYGVVLVIFRAFNFLIYSGIGNYLRNKRKDQYLFVLLIALLLLAQWRCQYCVNPITVGLFLGGSLCFAPKLFQQRVSNFVPWIICILGILVSIDVIFVQREYLWFLNQGWKATILVVWVTFWAFWAQLRANKIASIAAQKTSIENTFFKMIDIHRENLQDIKITPNNNSSSSDPKETIVGKDAIKEVCSLIFKYWESKMVSKSINNSNRNSELQKIYIAFSDVFDRNNCKNEYVNKEPTNGFYNRDDQILHDGNECKSALVTYSSHLYRMIKYIITRSSEVLSDNDKIEYVKILREQMTREELTFIFYYWFAGYQSMGQKDNCKMPRRSFGYSLEEDIDHAKDPDNLQNYLTFSHLLVYANLDYLIPELRYLVDKYRDECNNVNNNEVLLRKRIRRSFESNALCCDVDLITDICKNGEILYNCHKGKENNPNDYPDRQTLQLIISVFAE